MTQTESFTTMEKQEKFDEYSGVWKQIMSLPRSTVEKIQAPIWSIAQCLESIPFYGSPSEEEELAKFSNSIGLDMNQSSAYHNTLRCMTPIEQLHLPVSVVEQEQYCSMIAHTPKCFSPITPEITPERMNTPTYPRTPPTPIPRLKKSWNDDRDFEEILNFSANVEVMHSRMRKFIPITIINPNSSNNVLCNENENNHHNSRRRTSSRSNLCEESDMLVDSLELFCLDIN